jgi:hypothetical protein
MDGAVKFKREMLDFAYQIIEKEIQGLEGPFAFWMLYFKMYEYCSYQYI